MTSKPSRFVRTGLALGVAAQAGLALVFTVYAGAPTWTHRLYVGAVAVATLVYARGGWERPGGKLGAALVLALAGAVFARTTVTTGLLAAGPVVLVAALAGAPWLLAALATRSRPLLASLLAAWLVANPALIAVTSIASLRFIYTYDVDHVRADLERIEREGEAEVLVSSLEVRRFDPRGIVRAGDELVVGFSDTSGLGNAYGAVAAPGRLLVSEITTGLLYDPVRDALLGIGDGDPDGDGDAGEDSSRWLYRYDRASHDLESVRLPRKWALASVLDDARRRIYVVHEFGTMSVVDADDLSPITEVELDVYHVDSAAASRATDRVYARSTDGWIAAVDLVDLSVQRRWVGPGSEGMGIAVSDARDEVYVADMAGTDLRVLDSRSLELEDRFPVGRGIRALSGLGASGRVAAGGYFDGMLHIVDPARREVVKRVFVGTLVRTIELDPEAPAVLVGSGVGLVRVRLD